MKAQIAELMERECLDVYGTVPFSAELVTRPHLLPHEPLLQSILCFLVPYRVGDAENLSEYAAARDYHFYMKALFARMLPVLRDAYPAAHFYGFSDHSPIDERETALRAGLGFLGKNRLLIHPSYGSYVFLACVLSDLPSDAWELPRRSVTEACLACGACLRACPSGVLRGAEGAVCLSELTQKKGMLSAEEANAIRAHGCAWGCDLCQAVCPYNIRAQKNGSLSPIPFFREARIPRLSSALLDAMPDEEFALRAYSWRKRETIKRNLDILEGNTDGGAEKGREADPE